MRVTRPVALILISPTSVLSLSRILPMSASSLPHCLTSQKMKHDHHFLVYYYV